MARTERELTPSHTPLKKILSSSLGTWRDNVSSYYSSVSFGPGPDLISDSKSFSFFGFSLPCSPLAADHQDNMGNGGLVLTKLGHLPIAMQILWVK